jgi:hypothetical protein
MVNANTLTYKDVDGDTVTIRLSKPVLTQSNVNSVFTFDTGAGSVNGDNTTAQRLQTLDLTAFSNGLSVKISAESANGGDGKANVSSIKATGIDLSSVTVSGDLGQITAGDDNTRTPGVGSLKVGSLSMQSSPGQSVIKGRLGTLSVSGDASPWMTVSGSTDGRIGGIAVGGSITGGDLKAEGAIGSIKVGGSYHDSAISCSSVGAVKIAGDVTDATDPLSVSSGIIADNNIGPVSIGGKVVGGAATALATIRSVGGRVTSVNVAGDVSSSAQLIWVDGNIGPVTIRGNLTGGSTALSSAIQSDNGSIAAVKVAGNVAGGAGNLSAEIEAPNGRIGSIKIGGNLSGGGGNESGHIDCVRLASLTVGGDIVGGAGQGSGSVSTGNAMGPVKVDNLVGGSGTESGSIFSFGKLTSVRIAGDVTGGSGESSAEIVGQQVGSVTIGGNVTGGAGKKSASIAADWNIGTVKVGGNWTAASIVAGYLAGADGYFNTADDVATLFASSGFSKIGSISIGGTVNGTDALANANDAFAFLSNKIRSVKIGGTPVALTNGLDNLPLGNTGDFRVIG